MTSQIQFQPLQCRVPDLSACDARLLVVSAIKEFKPTDATTNPSLILAASKIEKYSKVIDQAVDYAMKHAE
jgi:transaldolase